MNHLWEMPEWRGAGDLKKLQDFLVLEYYVKVTLFPKKKKIVYTAYVFSFNELINQQVIIFRANTNVM